MKPRQILLKAAKRIASGQSLYSCIAVEKVCPPRSRLLRHEYAWLASPKTGAELCATDISMAIWPSSDPVAMREFRVLLLLTILAAYNDIKEVQ